MKRLLFQLDGDRLPSAFDRVVGYDGGADEVFSYGGVTEEDVRPLVYGAIFTRGPRDLKNTALFLGGSKVALAERMLAIARASFLGPLRVSIMLDPNGSNTTAAAAVAKMVAAFGSAVEGRRAVVFGGTGPVGTRAAGLLLRLGVRVRITARTRERGETAAAEIRERFGGEVEIAPTPTPDHAAAALEGMELLLASGPEGLRMVPREAWTGRPGLRVAADVNAVPPLGIEGIEVTDDGEERAGVRAFGALGIGGLKMKLHKACIAKLFESSEQILDAETIYDLATEL